MDISAKKAKSLKNAEKRRERSKVAARSRRGKECEIFNDLSACLPMPESSKASLDKASVMRLTLCDLRIKQMFDEALKTPNNKVETDFKDEFDSLVNNALGGFVLVCTLDGDIIYASEGINTHLGICQYEIMGQNIFDVSHQYDHSDIRSLLGVKKDEKDDTLPRSGLFRMKCTVSSRGRNAHLRTANYKVINCVGRITEGDSSSDKWFVSVCEPLLHPSDVDIPLNKQIFLSKHSADMKFEYVDESVGDLMGYTSEDMLGKSLFEFTHAMDGDGIAKSFKSLYEKDQNQTDRYRFLTKGGGWIWLITQATVICGSNTKTPNSVVCIHFITSGREEETTIVSEIQMDKSNTNACSPVVLPDVPTARNVPTVSRGILAETNMKNNIPVVEINNIFPWKRSAHSKNNTVEENNFLAELLTGPMLNNATCSTSKIFAPKTDDMDSGFLMPVDDNTLIISKEEPEDLTHLAPIAGDGCVPLEVPLLEDLLASLDEADMAYCILDPDSDEIPAFDFNEMSRNCNPNKSKEKTTISSKGYYDSLLLPQNHLTSSPLIMKSDRIAADPILYSTPQSSSFHSPSTTRISIAGKERDFHNRLSHESEFNCSSLPLLNHLKDPFLSSGRLSTSPLPPEIPNNSPNISDLTQQEERELPSSPFECDETKDNSTFWNPPEERHFDLIRLCNSTSLPLKPPLEIDCTSGMDSSKNIPSSIHNEDGSDWKLLLEDELIASNHKEMMKNLMGPTPRKMTKLIDGDIDPGPSSQMYILLPVAPRRRTSSVGSITGLNSSSSISCHTSSESGDSNDSSSPKLYDLADLVQTSSFENNKFKELLNSMKAELEISGLSNSATKLPKNDYSEEAGSLRMRKRNFTGSLLCDKPLSFHVLTRQDCEVNAPLNPNSKLLQGPELLCALDERWNNFQ